MPTTDRNALDDFMFDLTGYLVLPQAVAPDLVERLNAEFDAFPHRLPRGGWYRGAQRRDYRPEVGYELHQAVTLGGPFEALIDHPRWLSHVLHYAGEQDSYVAGVYIDESIASARSSGGHHPVHSGGYRGALRGRYGYSDGVFRCGQVNVIVALTDIGPGDGATMVIPGSHKSRLPHPLIEQFSGDGAQMDTLPGAVPVFLQKGDALLFVDGLMHGASTRTNPDGERRVIIYRYGPVWGASRLGYVYDEGWLAALPASRRCIVQPKPPVAVGSAIVPE